MARRKDTHRPAAARRSLSSSKRAGSAPLPLVDTTRPFPILEDFVLHGEGQISIGEAGPVVCAAVASDTHTMFAALQRRKGENLMQLLARLELALSRALEHDEYIDEIND